MVSIIDLSLLRGLHKGLLHGLSMCGPEGYVFSGVLVINKVSIVAILVIKVWFCTLVFNRVYF